MEESGGGLDLVEVEGVVAGHGAVEPGLEEGGPPVPELVRTPLVVLADPSNSRVDDLATVHELNCRFPAWKCEDVDEISYLFCKTGKG